MKTLPASEFVTEQQTLILLTEEAEEISWICEDPPLLSNEMCGEGLAPTDGEDYRISDCKPGNLLGGVGGI